MPNVPRVKSSSRTTPTRTWPGLLAAGIFVLSAYLLHHFTKASKAAPVAAAQEAPPLDMFVVWTRNLRSADEEEWRKAATKLREAGEASRPYLMATLNDENWQARASAKRLLGMLDSKDMLEKILASAVEVRSMQADVEEKLWWTSATTPVVATKRLLTDGKRYAATGVNFEETPQREVYDGTTLWVERQFEDRPWVSKYVRPLNNDCIPTLASYLERRWFVTKITEATLEDGREVYHLESGRHDKSSAECKLTVERSTGLVIYEETKDFSLRESRQYTNIQINIDVTEAIFNYVPPTNAKMVDF
jgi:hypothetical protein